MTDASGVVKPDHAYPVLMNLLPIGMKGLAFAALTAAVVASLAGKCNSISTIFTLDLYKKYIDKSASEQKLVNVGRWAIVASFGVAISLAPMLRSLDQVYQYIQEYTNFITPGSIRHFPVRLLLETRHQPGRYGSGYPDDSVFDLTQILAGSNGSH